MPETNAGAGGEPDEIEAELTAMRASHDALAPLSEDSRQHVLMALHALYDLPPERALTSPHLILRRRAER